MNRHERVNLFMIFYYSALYNRLKDKCIDCYFYAENSIEQLTSSRQYSSYASFRASMSRREKMKRLALKNK